MLSLIYARSEKDVTAIFEDIQRELRRFEGKTIIVDNDDDDFNSSFIANILAFAGSKLSCGFIEAKFKCGKRYLGYIVDSRYTIDSKDNGIAIWTSCILANFLKTGNDPYLKDFGKTLNSAIQELQNLNAKSEEVRQNV